MAYVPTTWVDHAVERPRTYNQAVNEDGSVTFTPAFGEVEREGTPINAQNMNHIEQGVKKNSDDIEYIRNDYATTDDYEAVFAADGWSAAAPYTQTISVEGVLATDTPILDVDMSGATLANYEAMAEQAALMVRVESGNGTLTATCFEDKPTIDLPILVKVVR